MACDRANVDNMIAMIRRFLNFRLSHKKHNERDITHEIYVDGELDLLNVEFTNFTPQTNRSIIYEYVHWSMLLDHFAPHLFYFILVGKIYLDKVASD